MKLKDNMKTKFRAGVCNLIIHETTMSDGGEYVCKATNDGGQVMTRATVQVKCKLLSPIKKIELDSYTVKESP